MIEKAYAIRHLGVDLFRVSQTHFVLFGFVKDLASHLGRRCARKRKCRERQDAGSDSSSIHSKGHASSDDQPTCLASPPTKSESFVQYAG